MPEGPELRIASTFINQIASKYTFSGRIIKGEKATKLDDVPFEADTYTINAESRGKELKLHLNDVSNEQNGQVSSEKEVKHILFRFGMSGCFKFTRSSEQEIPKHAHLRFTTKKGEHILSFVDYRRFGKWVINGEWGKDRGPDPLSDYKNFRNTILRNLNDAAFNRPICEAMLNQKYFNGIGNYLRAEILFRSDIPPFDRARDVLSELLSMEEKSASLIILDKAIKNEETNKIKKEHGVYDILELCNVVPNEVLQLSGGKGYDVDHNPDDEKVFTDWLQCYTKDGMKNLVDANGRTIWFRGQAGALKPSNAKSRLKRSKGSSTVTKEVDIKDSVNKQLKVEIKPLATESIQIKHEYEANPKDLRRTRRSKRKR